MNDLFQAGGFDEQVMQPFAELMRPQSLDDVIGQDHLLGEAGPIARMVRRNQLSSFVLWGPPGVGKTTVAQLVAAQTDSEFVKLSAIFSGVGELRKVFEAAKTHRAAGRATLLFVDEIHRFNKSQQDSFLPHLESGLITLIGATTENPSFELNAALLSRAQVFVLNRLDDDAMEALLARAETVRDARLPLTDDARGRLRAMADGDGRYLLTMAGALLDEFVDHPPIDTEKLSDFVQRRAVSHDKSGDGHYDLASALQKSIRGSDMDAALYWAARMVVAGEDLRFIIRRLVVVASEDIGNADPQALPLAIAALEANEFVGPPESHIALGQLVAYLATAPKSNRSHIAFKAAIAAARASGNLSPPPHAVNAPTKLMKDLGASTGYVYDHNAEDGFAGLNYFPVDMPRETFYEPSNFGFDKEIAKRLAYWARRRSD